MRLDSCSMSDEIGRLGRSHPLVCLSFKYFMNSLKIEHDRIDYLLAQGSEDPTEYGILSDFDVLS